MRNILFILLLLPVIGWGQTLETQFCVVAEFGAFSNPTDSTYRGNITITADQLGEGYLATQIDSGDYAVDLVNNHIFRVIAVNSSTFSTANVDLLELTDHNTDPQGVGVVYEPDLRYPYVIPSPPSNNQGITAAGLAKVLINNINQIHDGVYSLSATSDPWGSGPGFWRGYHYYLQRSHMGRFHRRRRPKRLPDGRANAAGDQR